MLIYESSLILYLHICIMKKFHPSSLNSFELLGIIAWLVSVFNGSDGNLFDESTLTWNTVRPEPVHITLTDEFIAQGIQDIFPHSPIISQNI